MTEKADIGNILHERKDGKKKAQEKRKRNE
jgi:hypothetical protein